MTEGGGGRRRAALLLVPVLLLGAAFCIWTLFASVTLGEAESFIPAPLGSDALANYGEDEITGRLRSLSISIIEAVIRDRDPEEEDAGARATDVSESLKSPVPTVTPKPGDPTGTPTATSTPELAVTGTTTATGSPSPSPIPSRTPTATRTDVPTAGPTSTSGPSATPSNTPICTAPPYIEIISPLADQRFTLAEELPGQAFAFDPDNVNPLTCSITPSTFPDDDGEGISGDPEVHMKIEWWSGSSWVLVHTEMEINKAYCPFGDIDPFCLTYDLSTNEWPDSTPINTGKHRLKAMVLQDDEGAPSGWVWVEFYIDPAPTPTPSNTPTPTSTPTPTNTIPVPTDTPTPVGSCSDITIPTQGDSGNDVWWDINSLWPGTIRIIEIYIAWPFGDDLNWIKFDSSTIWNGTGSAPDETINSGWTGATNREMNNGDTFELRFAFQDSPQDGTYELRLQFDNLCTATWGPAFIDTE